METLSVKDMAALAEIAAKACHQVETGDEQIKHLAELLAARDKEIERLTVRLDAALNEQGD